jgi:hypothetical protein
MQKIRIIGFFFENRLHWQFEVDKKNSTNGHLRLHIYLHTDKILIHNPNKWSATVCCTVLMRHVSAHTQGAKTPKTRYYIANHIMLLLGLGFL